MTRAPRLCLGTSTRRCASRIYRGSRCSDCAAEHEAARERGRAERRRSSEPWRMLYRTQQWRRARTHRLVIDGRRCVDCGSSSTLGVDHLVPLRSLWALHVLELADDAGFVAAACDVDQLRTRCPSCHAAAELARRG